MKSSVGQWLRVFEKERKKDDDLNVRNQSKAKEALINTLSIAYVGLGSNLSDPVLQLKRAIESLGMLDKTQVLKVSPFYQTKPVGYLEQPDFQNAVVKLETQLSPEDLLDGLQKIENQQGRVRKQENGPRTIDLDILLYDSLSIRSERLTIPHPRMYERTFVLKPLSDIAPELIPESLTES